MKNNSEKNCANCGKSLPSEELVCPYCRASQQNYFDLQVPCKIASLRDHSPINEQLIDQIIQRR